MADDDFDFAYEVALLRKGYECGDKSAVLKTILASIVLRQPLPEWAAKAFEDACEKVMTGHARS